MQRVRNTTTGHRRVRAGYLSFWQPDEEGTRNVLHSEFVQRKPTPWESWSWARHWGAVTRSDTGRTAVLVSPYPNVLVMDWGEPGGHLGWWAQVDLEPGSTAERVCYVVLCASLEEAKRYAWLKDYL